MKGWGCWGVLLATSPQPICSQDTSIIPFCVEINSVLGWGRVESDNFRPKKSSRRLCRGYHVLGAIQALCCRL